MTPASFDKSQVVQTLQGLMDRLTNPDLTAAEANTLRPRLHHLLEAIDHGTTDVEGDRRAD